MGNKLKKIISIHCALIVFFYGLTAFAENKYFLAPPHTPVSIINADILFRIVLEAKFELLRKDAPIKIYLGNHSFSVPPALRKHVYLVRIKTANKSSMYVPWNEKKARNINRIEMVDKQNPHNRLIFRLSKKEVSIERQLNGNTLEYHSFERSKKRGYSKPLRAYPIFLNFEDNAYNFPTSEPGIPFTERADKIFRMLTARGNIHSQASNSLTIGRYTVRLPDAYRLSGDRNAGRTVLTTKSKDQGRGSRFATIFDRLNHAIRLVFESRLEWISPLGGQRKYLLKRKPHFTQIQNLEMFMKILTERQQEYSEEEYLAPHYLWALLKVEAYALPSALPIPVI